jgi:hypothetical protein
VRRFTPINFANWDWLIFAASRIARTSGSLSLVARTPATDLPARGGRHQQEALEGAQLVVGSVLLAKADERRELDEHHLAQNARLAYTRQA